MATYAYIQQRSETNRKARQFLQDLLTEGPQTYQVVLEQAVKKGAFVGHTNAGQVYSPCRIPQERWLRGLEPTSRCLVTSPPWLRTGDSLPLWVCAAPGF